MTDNERIARWNAADTYMEQERQMEPDQRASFIAGWDARAAIADVPPEVVQLVILQWGTDEEAEAVPYIADHKRGIAWAREQATGGGG